MANEDTVRGMMTSAGYTEIAFKRVDAKVLIGRNVEDAIAFQLALGPAGEVYREAGAEAEEKREEIEQALTKALAAQAETKDGIVMDTRHG